MIIILALHLVSFTAPDDQHMVDNPEEVVSIRRKRSHVHFGAAMFTSARISIA